MQKQLMVLNRYLNRLAQDYNLYSTRYDMLSVICDNYPITLSNLATIQGISLPSTSKTIDELVNEGLVSRTRLDDDKRKCNVIPTSTGINKLRDIIDWNENYWDSKLKYLSDQEQEQIEESLSILVDALLK